MSPQNTFLNKIYLYSNIFDQIQFCACKPIKLLVKFNVEVGFRIGIVRIIPGEILCQPFITLIREWIEPGLYEPLMRGKARWFFTFVHCLFHPPDKTNGKVIKTKRLSAVRSFQTFFLTCHSPIPKREKRAFPSNSVSSLLGNLLLNAIFVNTLTRGQP